MASLSQQTHHTINTSHLLKCLSVLTWWLFPKFCPRESECWSVSEIAPLRPQIWDSSSSGSWISSYLGKSLFSVNEPLFLSLMQQKQFSSSSPIPPGIGSALPWFKMIPKAPLALPSPPFSWLSIHLPGSCCHALMVPDCCWNAQFHLHATASQNCRGR